MKNTFVKRIMLVTLVFVITFLSCCKPTDSESSNSNSEPTEEPKEVYPTKISDSNNRYHSLAYVDHTVSGMHYRLFTTVNGDIYVVNVTKDSLEVKDLER